MATIVINNQSTSTAASAVVVDLNGGSKAYVTTAGSIIASGDGSTAISTGNGCSVNVAGEVFASDTAIDFGYDGRLTVATSGIVTSASGLGVNMEGSTATILNGGEIDAAVDAVHVQAARNYVDTSGTVNGQVRGIFMRGGGDGLTNSGSVTGGINGVEMDEYAGVGGTIYNSGTIIGLANDGIYSNSYGGSVSLTNDGLLSGGTNGIETTGAADQIINNGKIAAGTGAGIRTGGTGTTITNTGTIAAARSDGVYVNTSAAGAVTTIANSGTISSTSKSATDAAIEVLTFSTDTTTIGNTGLIQSSGRYAIYLGDGIDSVANGGTIVGGVFLGDGNDIFDGSEGNVSGTVFGDYGNDTLTGGASNDVFDGGFGADDIDGGGGTDMASYLSAAAGVTVNLLDDSLNTGDALGDTLTSIAWLEGSSFADTLIGDANDNHLYGQAGNDRLSGGAGNDRLLGGIGSDLLDGGAGNDRLDGGDGEDTADYGTAAAAVRVSLALGGQDTGGSGRDRLISIEDLIGSGFGDTLTGSAGNNEISGGGGNDRIDGGAGSDKVTGGAGSDTFLFDTGIGGKNVQSITDFLPGTDLISLDRGTFKALAGTGALAAAAFYTGTGAHDADDRIIYNASTGDIFYDADGNGSGAQVRFAHVTAGLGLSNGSFTVV